MTSFDSHSSIENQKYPSHENTEPAEAIATAQESKILEVRSGKASEKSLSRSGTAKSKTRSHKGQTEPLY